MSDKDTIYRQAAIDAFWKLDIELKPSAIDAITDMLKKLPSAQPDCSDCIKHGGDWDCDHIHCHIGRYAQPERKGKWIKMSDADGIYWACSECGEDIPRVSHYDPQFDLFPRLKSIEKTNFCPNCGARMEEDDD